MYGFKHQPDNWWESQISEHRAYVQVRCFYDSKTFALIFYQNGWLIEKGKYQPEFLSCINHNIIFSQDALNTSYNGNLIVWGLYHGRFVQHI